MLPEISADLPLAPRWRRFGAVAGVALVLLALGYGFAVRAGAARAFGLYIAAPVLALIGCGYVVMLLADPARRPLAWLHLTLGLLGAAMAVPFYYNVTTSFKSLEDVTRIPIHISPFFQPTLQPYRALLEGLPYFRFMLNSLIVSGSITIGTIFLCTMAGYAFSKLTFPGRDGIFFVLLSSLMIPYSVLLVPGFLLMRDLGWLNTFWSLIIPALAPAFYIFLAKQFIGSVPNDLLDAARIDGCSEWGIFIRIVLPLSRPLMATLGILAFLYSWNNFVWPLIMLQDETKYTLPLGISLLQGRYTQRENIQMAGAALAIIPVLVLFFAFQRQIIQSLSTSGLKEQ